MIICEFYRLYLIKCTKMTPVSRIKSALILKGCKITLKIYQFLIKDYGILYRLQLS